MFRKLFHLTKLNHEKKEGRLGFRYCRERFSARNQKSDLIFQIKASLHNTSVPMTGKRGQLLPGLWLSLSYNSSVSPPTALLCVFPIPTSYSKIKEFTYIKSLSKE